jgi:glycine/D-amino acid oxidase-like deaminating enzyme
MQTADICVIGGGLLGTATAYFGACAGLKVILLEEKDLAAGASGAAFGGVSVGIYSYSSARVPETYVAISKASLELYRRLQEELGPPLDFYSPGSLDPFYSEEGLARGRNGPPVFAHVVACELRMVRRFVPSSRRFPTWCVGQSTARSMGM